MSKMASGTKWQIQFGALARPIEEQLADQKLCLPHVERFQRVADAISLLCVQGLLTDAEITRARKRLISLLGDELLNVS